MVPYDRRNMSTILHTHSDINSYLAIFVVDDMIVDDAERTRTFAPVCLFVS